MHENGISLCRKAPICFLYCKAYFSVLYVKFSWRFLILKGKTNVLDSVINIYIIIRYLFLLQYIITNFLLHRAHFLRDSLPDVIVLSLSFPPYFHMMFNLKNLVLKIFTTHRRLASWIMHFTFNVYFPGALPNFEPAFYAHFPSIRARFIEYFFHSAKCQTVFFVCKSRHRTTSEIIK